MPPPESLHYPSLAGGIEAVTGTLVIDTGLRDLQTFMCSLNADAVVANEEQVVAWKEEADDGSGTVKVKLSVFKGGTAAGSAGDSAVDVSWYALGK